MPAQAPPRPLRFPVLLDQQFWFLGHDIRHAHGNALQRFGFVRWRSPAQGGTSCYVYALTAEAPYEAVVCWGFGAYCGPVHFSALNDTGDRGSRNDEPEHPAAAFPDSSNGQAYRPAGGVLLPRHASSARLTDRPLALPLHQLGQLPRGHVARTGTEQERVHHGIAAVAELFARYEAWAPSVLGQQYRLQTLAELPRHKRKRFDRSADLRAHWESWRQ